MIISYKFCFFVSAALLLLACTREPAKRFALESRHDPVPGNSLFSYRGGFSAYIEQTRRKLSASRLKATEAGKRQWLEGNLPFLLLPGSECKKNQQGRYARSIVLTHGMSDSPYFMKPIGEYFQQQCFVVLGILLPGHGSRPGDLVNISWREWVKAQNYGIDQAYKYANQVYLGGFSIGGALALNAAAGRHDLAGVFLFSPAIEISPVAFFAKFHRFIASISRRLSWLHIGPDDSPYKYQSLHLNAISQTNKLLKYTRRKIAGEGLHVPVFMAVSWEDETVDVSAAIEFYYRLSHPKKHILLFSQRRMLWKKYQKRNDSPDNSQEILSLSHVGIMIPPEDPVYGVDGSYKECEYYLKKPSEYRICKKGLAPFVGELTPENIRRGVVQRITYNPWWQQTTDEISEFISDI